LHCDALSHAQWFDAMLSVGGYGPARMWMPNIGIEIAYNSGVMVAASGRIVWHGVDNVNGDRISWVWYMWDDVHQFVDVPRAEYSKYMSIIDDSLSCT
ncbi:hypothetical protein F4604DRAFT_1598935, partial [Suillus subluteus]